MRQISGNSVKTQPFNANLARLGVPIVTTLGFPVRIICWDLNGTDLVALIGVTHEGKFEEPGVFSSTGVSGKNFFGNLTMAPMATVEGQPVFHGDQVYDSMGKPVSINWRDHGHAKGEELSYLTIQSLPISFDGKKINIDTMIWYRSDVSHVWQYVKAGDNWTDSPGIEESHFEYLKRNEGRGMCLQNYTTTCPFDMTIEGVEIKDTDVLWNKLNGYKMDFKGGAVSQFLNGAFQAGNYTRVAPTQKESWQARVVRKDGQRGSEKFFGEVHPNKEECEFESRKILPDYYEFIKAERISTYYA